MERKICVIGLGYVGLPLARLFSTKFETVGFDMNQCRVDALMTGHDATLEVSDELLQDAIQNHRFRCTTNIEKIRDCNFYVVAVPTPVDENNRPDLKPLWGASETVGKVISKGDIVVYESTVYPGVTEEECLPVVEKVSGLKFNKDFLLDILRSVLIREISFIRLRKLKRLHQDLLRKLLILWMRFIMLYWSMGHIKPLLSRWLKLRRSLKIHRGT